MASMLWITAIIVVSGIILLMFLGARIAVRHWWAQGYWEGRFDEMKNNPLHPQAIEFLGADGRNYVKKMRDIQEVLGKGSKAL